MEIYLDTHVVVWAYAGETERFPARVCEYIEQGDLLISPMVLLELQYLKEIGRLLVDPGVVYEGLASSIGLKVSDLGLMRVVTEAMIQPWTRDPFDSMITATARAANAVLLTKDQCILDHYEKACWN
jgi:PIN domain nuclease of toxin-antitoxin system